MDKKKGTIRMVEHARDDNKAEDEEDEYRYEEVQDERWGKYWVCTAVPSAKRARSEMEVDDASSNGGATSQKAGRKASGKGKGKGGVGKGPSGGCHECGGDHFVRDCTIRKAKMAEKGKGKGKWN